jgi:threonine dehydratase
VTEADVREAADGLRGVARRTPLIRVDALGAWLKLENLQPVGAFKIRGAYTAVRRLSVEFRRRGVITYSSGNHGQALAFAAHRLGCRAVVVMRDRGGEGRGVRRWGARWCRGQDLGGPPRARGNPGDRAGPHHRPPFDDPAIIAGRRRWDSEIAADLPGVETVVVPVGGAGLISGVVTGLAAAGSAAGVWGVEPEGAPKLSRSLDAGHPVVLERSRSLADGLITLTVGKRNFAQLQAHADRLRGVVLVDDDSLRQAVHFLYHTCGLVVEPSGAATTAALRSGAIHATGPTVLVVSGNVDPALFDD